MQRSRGSSLRSVILAAGSTDSLEQHFQKINSRENVRNLIFFSFFFLGFVLKLGFCFEIRGSF
jgi:hypothetical protein